jgi:outer membrane receptor protein involved in Fe transport
MISEYLQKTYGYETGPYDNYSTEIKRTKFLARLDWNISTNHRFNVRYNQVEGGEPNPPSTSTSGTGNSFASGAGRTDVNALWFKNSNYFQGANFYSFAAELNSVLGKKIANTLRGTYTSQDDSRTTESSTFPFVDILKDGSPFTSFGYEPFSFGNLRKVKTYSFVDNVTWTLNNNNITIGAQADFSTTINGFQRFATSYYRFNTWDDFVTGKNPTDFAYTYSLSPGFAQAFPGFKFAQYSLYAQDEITINPRFRLTAAIRFDQPTYPDVSEIKTHPLVAALTFSEGQKLNTGNLPKASLLVSPRVGFNWDVEGDRSFQIRGGSGIFTGRVPFVWIVSQSGDAGLLQVTQRESAALGTA